MEIAKKRRYKYSGVAIAAVLLSAFLLVQPMQIADALQSQSVEAEALEIKEDSCKLKTIPEDPISMNTIRRGSIAKTIHSEKAVWGCLLEQGNLPVTLEITIFVEIFTNISQREILNTFVVATACLKDPITLHILDCASRTITEVTPTFVTNCSEGSISHPQEMNTVNKGNDVLTIEAQKEIFFCTPSSKVDVLIFTLIFDDLSTISSSEVTASQIELFFIKFQLFGFRLAEALFEGTLDELLLIAIVLTFVLDP